MLLEIICLVLFACLVAYFVVTIIIISKYKRIKKMANYLKHRYSVINKKAYCVDRNLTLCEDYCINLDTLRESFNLLYDEIYEIADEIYKEEI